MKKFLIVKKEEGLPARTDWLKLCSEEEIETEIEKLRKDSKLSYKVYIISDSFCDIIDFKGKRSVIYDEI